MATLSPKEIINLQAYMRQKFTHPGLQVKARPKATDSAEVLLENEFIGVLYKDDEDDDISYNFTMAILAEDLED